MEPLSVSQEAFEDYCYEDENGNGPSIRNYHPKRLIKGIDLKDLCDGKEVTFEISNEDEKNILEKDEQDNLNDVINFDSKSQRENRGAPPLNSSFESIAQGMVDVTEDGLVKKQIITNGIGKIVPDNAYVIVHYNFYKEHCEVPFDSTYLRSRPEKFRLDQGETIPGLEYAIKSMKKNENSRFFINWELAFGEMGCPDRIEQKCDIIADVTLINFVEINNTQNLHNLTESEINKMDFYKSLNQAKQLHLNGSDEFAKVNFNAAINCYKKVLRILNNLRLADEEQETSMLKQKVKCLVNLAVCYNKLGKHEQACLACQEALAIDCKNVKAHFHYGKANLALSNFQAAQQLLLKANKLKPNDKDISKELKRLDDKKALNEILNKTFWKKAFQNTKEEKQKPEETPSHLVGLEEKLRTSLEKWTVEEKPYVFPGPLVQDEIKLCRKIANSMNLHFETKDGVCRSMMEFLWPAMPRNKMKLKSENTRQFTSFLKDLESEYGDLRYYAKV